MTNAGGRVALVTGGAGFIGTAISPALAEAFGEVVAVDSMHPQVHSSPERPATLDERVRLVRADITEEATWDALLDEVAPDVVVHLAAETGTGQSLAESTRHAMANVVGTTRMLDAFHRVGRLPSRIVLTSSRAVYGEGAWRRADGTLFYPGPRSSKTLEASEWDYPDAEPTAMRADEVLPSPASVYGSTKLSQEQILRFWADAYGVEATVLRLQNVYGPGQSLINPYTGIMSLFCRMARGGRSIPLYEDGRVRRDFVLIDDVASAVVQAAVRGASGDGPIDIGSGETQTIATAAELIAAHYGAPAPHVTGQFRHGDVRHAWADVTAARERLDWEPQWSLKDGVARLASWIDEQPDVRDA